MEDYVGKVLTRAQKKQTEAETLRAKEATKASQANIASWEEMHEQPSNDSNNNDKSVE